jgi:DNA-binding LytR/AlgR family response regulator
LIIDDEPLARELLESHLEKFDEFELVAACENALKANKLLEANDIDLIFLDIEMPLLKGNDFLKKLASPPKAILTTAYREYAIEGFELNVVDYLLKPITFERFFVAINKFKQTRKDLPRVKPDELPKTHMYVTNGTKNIRLALNDILFIESVRDYIKIHMEHKKVHTVKFNISAFEKLLEKEFVRIHRSYIINKNRLSAYSKNEVEINGFQIPIGSSYKEKWLETIAGGEFT